MSTMASTFKTKNPKLDAFLMGSDWFHEFRNAGVDIESDEALKVACDRKADEEQVAPELRSHVYCGVLDEQATFFCWD